MAANRFLFSIFIFLKPSHAENGSFFLQKTNHQMKGAIANKMTWIIELMNKFIIEDIISLPFIHYRH